jgi:signal transduction histidine kinase
LVLGDAGQPNAAITLPYYNAVTGGPVGTAQLVIQRDPSLLLGIRRDVNGLMAVSLGLSLLLALVLAVGLASQVSRPLAELAEKTGRVELDRLDVDFASPRDDEVGALANLLAAMTARLRASAAQLRDAERRAVTGELARQINHDVKNGLAPIRHVLRHLGETAVKSPERLAAVFAERRETLESSVGYLEELARNYARLAPVLDRGPSDLGALLEEVARGARTDSVQIEVRLAPELPRVKADLVVLRRITENLLSNAVDALERGTGRVTLAAEPVAAPEPLVRLQVTDSGRGMTQEELGRAFDDFHTTKPSGTGLGLSVVRRLVADLGGSLRVESRPGQGSTFSVEIPAA